MAMISDGSDREDMSVKSLSQVCQEEIHLSNIRRISQLAAVIEYSAKFYPGPNFKHYSAKYIMRISNHR